MCVASYRHLLGLVLQAAWWLDGAGSGGQPVGQHGGQSADANQRGRRQGAKEMAQLVHLGYPQAAHHLRGLHLFHQRGTQLWNMQDTRVCHAKMNFCSCVYEVGKVGNSKTPRRCWKMSRSNAG